MFTDSYHGSVFSSIFNREDKTGDMSSRINTLLSSFGIQDRKYIKQDYSDIFNIRYDNVERVMQENKKISLDYLHSVIEL